MGSEYGTIFAEIYIKVPTDFINITDQHLNAYQYLKKALDMPYNMTVLGRNEYYRLKDFFQNSYSYINYNGTYFYVRLLGAV